MADLGLLLLQTMAFMMIAPWLAWIIAALFFGIGRWRYSRTALVAAALWLLYGVYETLMALRILCSGECNIRIDLLAIYPLLILVSLAALIASLWPRQATTH